MEDISEQCFAAFDSEVRRAYTWAYVAAAARANASAPPDATVALSSVNAEVVLPPLTPPEPPKRSTRRETMCYGQKLPYSDRTLQRTNRAMTTEAALQDALEQGALFVNVRDWAVLDVDVEPYIALVVRATLGDFEAVTYRTLDDFRGLRVIDTHGTRVSFPAHLSSLARAALSTDPPRSKAPLFGSVRRCLAKGHERPHQHENAAGASGAAAAEALGKRLQSYLVALCKNAFSRDLAAWLGFKLDCVSLASRTYGPSSSNSSASISETLSAPAAAAVALHTLYGRTIAEVESASRQPAFEVYSQAAAYFNTLDEGLVWWVVAEHVRRGALRARSSISMGMTWLPGATPEVPLSKEQRREREGLKTALVAALREPAQHRVAATLESLGAFAHAHGSAEALQRCYQCVLAPLTERAVAPVLADGGCAAAQCVARVVCAMLEQHVLTQAVMEPLANVDVQLAQFVAGCVRDAAARAATAATAKKAGILLLGTRLLVSTEVSKSTHAFATDLARNLAACTRTTLRPLLGDARSTRAVAAMLACVPTLVRAVLHVVLSDAPVADAAVAVTHGPTASVDGFAAEFAKAVRKVRDSSYSDDRTAIATQRTCLVQAWRALYRAHRTVAWRAGYILEKSLIDQYVQQSTALKPGALRAQQLSQPHPQAAAAATATAAAATATATVPSGAVSVASVLSVAACPDSAEGLGTGGSRAGSMCSARFCPERAALRAAAAAKRRAAAAEATQPLATPHPYALGFAMDSVRRHLHALADATAAACWCVVPEFERALAAAAHGISRSARKGAAHTPWAQVVEGAAVSAFEASFARLRAQLWRLTVSMLVRFVGDVLVLGGAADRVRESPDGRKQLEAAARERDVLGDVLQPDAALEVAVALELAHAVRPVVEPWAETVRDRYTVFRDATARTAAGWGEQTPEPLSLGSDAYSGTGSFTSEDDEEDGNDPLPNDDESFPTSEYSVDSSSCSESFLPTAMTGYKSASSSSDSDGDEIVADDN